MKIGKCGHVLHRYGGCLACEEGIRITDICLYKYNRSHKYFHVHEDKTPWLVGTSGRRRFGFTFIRKATKEDIKKIRKRDDWID